MTMALHGPRRMPRDGRAKALIVLVHGYGASGNDLIALADAWQDLLPAAAFVAPNAPERLPYDAVDGFQWFNLTFRDAEELRAGCERAGPQLDSFIDEELARYGLEPNRLALVGFSQGTMLALHVGLRRKPTLAAILGYSGLIAGPEHLVRAREGFEPGEQPAVLLVHGEQDEVIPISALDLTANALANAGVAASWHRSPGLGHGIDEEGLVLGGRFLVQALV